MRIGGFVKSIEPIGGISAARPTRQAGFRAALDHDDFGLNQSKIMNVIDSNTLERDAGGKPVPTFPHPALDHPAFKWHHLKADKMIEIQRFRASDNPKTAHTFGSDALEARLNASTLPQEIAFLSGYGVQAAVLIAASRRAQKEGTTPDRALLAYGGVEERFFYRCLARHLGVPFIDEPIALLDMPAETYAQALHAGVVPFAGPMGSAWLAAPRGPQLVALFRGAKRGDGPRSRLTITTPAHLSRCVRDKARRKIAADASFDLLSFDRELCAQSGPNLFQKSCACGGAFIFVISFVMAPALAAGFWAAFTGLMFLASIVFRLWVSANAIGTSSARRLKLEDHQLPTYTILVALYHEARIARRLVANLERIDYPRAKLEIKLILEEDDRETYHALAALRLSPVYEIIVAPPGQPRTKPRALNVALPLARGSLLAVFDAEDAPDPQQLRLAAERFAHAPSNLACLQGRLSIENARENWLTGLFAIEYSALFELQNIGLADMHLPFPVSGSSNHFRTAVLREIHGWDAWNVTEDADIGLRLARFGYCVDVLDSVTLEEAPLSRKAWLGQRRRWYKGWFQSFVTVSRSPFQVMAEIGFARSASLALLFVGLLVGPLFWIPASLILIGTIAANVWTASDFWSLCLSTLWTSVCLAGLGSILWHALMGMKRRRLLDLWPVLPLLLPYYGLHTIAAWMALYELFRHPFHWQKTEHGLSGATQRRKQSDEAKPWLKHDIGRGERAPSLS